MGCPRRDQIDAAHKPAPKSGPAQSQCLETATPESAHLVNGLSKRLMVDLSEIDSNKWTKLAAYLVKPQATPVSRTTKSTPRSGSKQKQRRFTEEEELRVVADYRAGGTVYSLARRYKCHRTTISRILKSHDVQLANSPTDAATIEEVVRLYRSGLSMEATAKRTGVSAKTVFNCLRKRDVRTRNALSGS